MAANECVPFKEPGSALTCKATTAVIGKRFLVVSGNRTGGGGAGLGTDLANVYQVAPAGAGVACLGVAGSDAANGSLLKVYTRPGMILPVTVGATPVVAGTECEVDSVGRVIPFSAGIKVGYVMTGAAAAADAEIKLY